MPEVTDLAWIPAARKVLLENEVVLLRWPVTSDGTQWKEREARVRIGKRTLELDSGGIIPIPESRAGMFVMRKQARQPATGFDREQWRS